MRAQRVVWPSRAKVEWLRRFALRSPSETMKYSRRHRMYTHQSRHGARAFLLGLPNAQGRYPSRPGYSNIGIVIEIGKAGYELSSRRTRRFHTRTHQPLCNLAEPFAESSID